METDPAGLAIVDEEDAKCTVTHKDMKWCFCCNYCKTQFTENPAWCARIASNVRSHLNDCS
ncbi:MAG: YHS domain-containing protein [Methanomicrobiales archaeon]|nr:YHS domain-containing protein [Methanomicrobiales archaeon]